MDKSTKSKHSLKKRGSKHQWDVSNLYYSKSLKPNLINLKSKILLVLSIPGLLLSNLYILLWSLLLDGPTKHITPMLITHSM